MNKFTHTIAVIDIESTGLRVEDGDSPVELCITHFDRDDKPTVVFHKLFKPSRPIPLEVSAIHGITDEMVASEQPFSAYAGEIFNLLDGFVIAGHNVGFDIRMLRAELGRYGYQINPKSICTLRESRRLMPGMESYKLDRINEVLGLHEGRAHSAQTDTLRCAHLLLTLMDKATAQNDVLEIREHGKHAAELPQVVMAQIASGNRVMLQPLMNTTGRTPSEISADWNRYKERFTKKGLVGAELFDACVASMLARGGYHIAADLITV